MAVKTLKEHEIYKLLKRNNLSVPNFTFIDLKSDNLKYLKWKTFPAVVKTVTEKPTHKTEAGIVIFCNDKNI